MRGVVGVFHELDATCGAIKALKQQSFKDFEVFTPTPRHEIDDAVGAGPSAVRRFTLVGGLLGVTFGYWIAVWTSDFWPLVVGGKPIAAWVPYTIIGFEMMVLCGALSTVWGMFLNARLPKISMGLGYDPRFGQGDYGIWVACSPDKIQTATTLLQRHGAAEVRGEQ